MATGIPGRNLAEPKGYELTYEGKLARSSVLELPWVQPRNVPLGNMPGCLHEGDALESLLWLFRQPDVRGTVRCVYIDPPYATTRNFVDRSGRDAYDDALSGAAYIEYVRRCLVVLREILADDGSIFVHLDQNMVFEIKLVMDEVFGRRQFRNFVTRKKCNTKNYTRRCFGNVSDHILFYSKGTDYVWNRPYDAWSESRLLEEYPYVDAASGRRYKKVPVHAPGVRRGATGGLWRGMSPPPGKHWQYTPDRLDEMDRLGEIYWSPTGNPRRMVFLDRAKGVPVQDVWMHFKDAHNQNIRVTGYPTEKNFELVSRIVAAASNEGDLVLDCFCGSGTTLEAAVSLGRRFVGIDRSSRAIEATVRRLASGREKMGDFAAERKRTRRAVAPQRSLFEQNE